MLTMLTFLVSFLLFASALAHGRQQEKCSALIEVWSERALLELSKLPEDHHLQLKELLYFLHVPRTGGRSYHQCLLRHMYPMEQHCDGSYDRLRFNSSKHCRLLVTHDDYSILTKLPAESTSIVSNVRHPVDRIFSAYEFSVEVAARFLARNLRRKPNALKPRRNQRSSTLNIWPWSLLVPWMREDLFKREEIRLSKRVNPQPTAISHYNASLYVMPLHEFIHQPIAMDILHNGATFQVAGLTNNSYTKEARTIRKCVIDFPDLGHHVLDVAKRRIDKMIFIGLTEKHKDSAKLFAHVVAAQILPLGKPNNTTSNILAVSTEPMLSISGDAEQVGHNSSSTDSQVDASSVPQGVPPPFAENLTVYGLIERYEKCSGRLRSTQVQRRISSLRNISPVNFSTEARREVVDETLEAIRQMNSLDLELYAYAQSRFSRYQVSAQDSISSQKPNQIVLDTPNSSSQHDYEAMADGGLRGGYQLDSEAVAEGGLHGGYHLNSEAVVDGGLLGGYPSWFGLKHRKFSMGLGMMTVIAALILLLKGGRVLRLKRRKISVVHEKL